MRYRKQNPREIDPKTYEQLASTGFKAAVSLLAQHMNCTNIEALSYLARQCGREFLQMQHYQKTGLPDHLVEVVLKVLAKNDVTFGCHQLRPNRSMVRAAFLNSTQSK